MHIGYQDIMYQLRHSKVKWLAQGHWDLRWLGYDPRSVVPEPIGLAALLLLVGTDSGFVCLPPSKGARLEFCPWLEFPLVPPSPCLPTPSGSPPIHLPSQGSFDGLFASTYPFHSNRRGAGGPGLCCCLEIKAPSPGLSSRRWASPVHFAHKANRP